MNYDETKVVVDAVLETRADFNRLIKAMIAWRSLFNPDSSGEITECPPEGKRDE